jgi:3-dehydroquinate dehydratase type I
VISAIVETMNSYAPTIYKISTYCKSPEDAVRLLTLICSLKKENKRCIILGMGKHGMITRIFGTLWGNEMIFAPQIEHEASAPGQLTKQQLDTIFATLQRKEQG